MKTEIKNSQLLSEAEIEAVSGAGFFYQVGRFFAIQANINDSLYRSYGNTNRNHIY